MTLSEQEIERLLRETITEVGTSYEIVRIERFAKFITQVCLYYRKNDERNKKCHVSEYVVERDQSEKDEDNSINGC